MRNKLTESLLDRAVETLIATELLGLVERFDESMVLFEEFLKPFYPEIDFSYRIQNVGQPKELSREQRMHNLKTTLGAALFAQLEANNFWDLQLYERAGREFAQRLERVADFPEKLALFKQRCRTKHFRLFP